MSQPDKLPRIFYKSTQRGDALSVCLESWQKFHNENRFYPLQFKVLIVSNI